MDYKYITALLERYFQGDTTLEEERILNDYFQQAEVHSSLREYSPLFCFFKEERSRVLPQTFAFHHKPVFRLRFMRYAAQAAAVLLLMFGLYKLYMPAPAAPAATSAAIDWSKYEPETPEEAFRVTRSAVLRLSAELNKGAAAAAKEVDKLSD